MAAKEKVNLSFADEKAKLSKFFSEFESADEFSDALHGRKYYLAQLQQISDRTKSLLEVFVEDLESYLVANDDSSLFSNILSNTKRYQKMMMEVVDALLPSAVRDYPDTVQDIILKQRLLTQDNLNS